MPEYETIDLVSTDSDDSDIIVVSIFVCSSLV